MRNTCLLSLSLAAACFAATVARAAELPDTSGMNVLFIIIEDCNAGVWGCYGNPICKTPHLDQFAKTAVQFDAAYVQAVACNPSRSSFLTGLRPLTSGVWNNGQVMSEHLPDGTITLPELLKRDGFSTAVIGKFFHRVDYAEKQLLAFDRIEMYGKPPGWQGPEAIVTFPPVRRTQRDPAPKNRNSKEYRQWRIRHSDRYGDSGLKPEEEGDYRISQTAVALLKDFCREETAVLPLGASIATAHAPDGAQAIRRHVRPGKDSRSAGTAGQPQRLSLPETRDRRQPGHLHGAAANAATGQGGHRGLLRLRQLRR